MISTDQARSLALALPEAIEADHHGRPSFRVAGRGESLLAGLLADAWENKAPRRLAGEG